MSGFILDRKSNIKNSFREGFTLVEIVVAIGMVAILALVVVPNVTSYIQRSDDTKNEVNINGVRSAAELAVQSNPNVYVKDIGRLTERTKVTKSGLTQEIAGYANADASELRLVQNADSVVHALENVYYISPDRTKTRIVVRYNSDRRMYSFDGQSQKSNNKENNANKDSTSIPGPQFIVAGDKKSGFYGEVSSSELFTGDELATYLGITEGQSQHSDAGWLKFSLDGKVIFKSKRTFRSHISWDDINAARAVDGSRIVVKDKKVYSVRLMKGANKNPAGDRWGIINHGSEWNRLMLPIHEESINQNWLYPNNVEKNIPKNWGIKYNDRDLHVGESAGNGRFQWMQETAQMETTRIVFGNMGISDSNAYPQNNRSLYVGWSPVLEWVGVTE